MTKQFVKLADGSLVEAQVLSKQEQNDQIRKPKVLEALTALTAGESKLAAWLQENEKDIIDAFDAGTVRRVTKSERNQLTKALEHVADTLKDDSKAKFVVDNIDAIITTFKWPGQTRATGDAKAALVSAALLDVTDGRQELVDWLVASQAKLEEAYAAGVVKRQVSPKAMEALAAYRAEKAAEKAKAAD